MCHPRRGIYSTPAAPLSVVLKGAALVSTPLSAGFASAASARRGRPGLPVELRQRQAKCSLNASYNSEYPRGQMNRTPPARAKVGRTRWLPLKEARGKSCGCATYAKKWRGNDLMREARGADRLSYSFCKRKDGKVTPQTIAGPTHGALKDQFCHGRLTIHVNPFRHFWSER